MPQQAENAETFSAAAADTSSDDGRTVEETGPAEATDITADIPDTNSSKPVAYQTKLNQWTPQLTNQEAAKFFFSSEGQQELKQKEADMKRWASADDSGVLHTFSKLPFDKIKVEDLNKKNTRLWLCPLCDAERCSSGTVMKHIRGQHKEADTRDVQCWRLCLLTNGCIRYDKSTAHKAPGLASNSTSPSTHSPTKKQPTEPAAGSKHKAKQQPVKHSSLTCCNENHPARQSGKRKLSDEGVAAKVSQQRGTSAAGPSSPSAKNTDTLHTEPILPSGSMHQPSNIKPPAVPKAAPTAPQAASCRREQQTQAGTADQQARHAQLTSKDRLEAVRLGLNFAENIIGKG